MKKFNMLKCNTTTALAKARFSLEKNGDEEVINPMYHRQILGSLRYFCNTRHDLAFSRFMEDPLKFDIMVAKRI